MTIFYLGLGLYAKSVAAASIRHLDTRHSKQKLQSHHTTMKLASAFLLPALAATAYASGEAAVYAFNQAADSSLSAKTAVPATVSPENAQLVLAHRLGLSQFYDLGNPSDEVVGLLNECAASQSALHGVDAEDRRRTMIIVEDIKVPEGMPILSSDGFGILIPARYSRSITQAVF